MQCPGQKKEGTRRPAHSSSPQVAGLGFLPSVEHRPASPIPGSPGGAVGPRPHKGWCVHCGDQGSFQPGSIIIAAAVNVPAPVDGELTGAFSLCVLGGTVGWWGGHKRVSKVTAPHQQWCESPPGPLAVFCPFILVLLVGWKYVTLWSMINDVEPLFICLSPI